MSLIAFIEGKLEIRGSDYAVVQVGGVSLKVFMAISELGTLSTIGDVVRLHTHLVVREDDLQLYGFVTDLGVRVFQLLLDVPGVGPKAALALLSALPPEALAAAIVSGDSQALSTAQGVGKRTADRIILDLKGKLEESGFLGLATVSAVDGWDDPALQALVALGYKPLEARQALSVEREPGLSLEERVRRALQRIGQA